MEIEGVAVEEERRLTQLRFDAAVKVIKSLPPDGPFQPSNDMMLKFYSYYKQATVGVCNIPRPGFWDAVGKAKWDAWNSLGNMSKEEAMTAYVDEMKLILEGMPMTDEVEELLRVLGPFYELIEEKKKISHISDVSTGFGTTLNALTSKSVAKDIIRTMERNGTLEMHPAQLKSKEARERLDEEEEEEEEEEEVEEEEEEEEEDELADVTKEAVKDKRSSAQPLKKGSSRRHKASLSNGKVGNGVIHLTNGSHSKATPVSESYHEEKALLNGHHSDVPGPSHLASDSDSEVYCDSVDQFGQEEISDPNHSLDDLEEESYALPPVEETQALHEDAHSAPQAVRCGGEDGENGRSMSQRQRLNADMQDNSLVRRGRGPKSPGRSTGFQVPMYSGGDGDGIRRGGAATPGGSLNEQIVVALARLQDDMQSVLERLHTLEALTASQARSMSLSPTYPSPPVNKRSRKPSWWPFDISPTSLAFAIIWPFVVQWLIRLYAQRRRRHLK